MSSSKNSGITYQQGVEKAKGTPVWPTRKPYVEVLLGFSEFALRNRDNKKLMAVLGYGLEAKRHEKVMAMYTKVAACGLDPAKAAALYDSIHGTSTSVEVSEADILLVSVPGPEHNGVGFHVIQVWEPLEHKVGDKWVKGYLSSPTAREDGRYEVSAEEDPMSETTLVDPTQIRRC